MKRIFAAFTVYTMCAVSTLSAQPKQQATHRLDLYDGGLTSHLERLLSSHQYSQDFDDPVRLSGQFNARIRMITTGGSSSPRISGDGKTIVFNTYERDIPATVLYRWIDGPNGGKIERLTPTTYNAMWGDLSYDGKVIAFTAQAKGPNADWDIQRWEGGKITTVASSPMNEYFLRLSSDGKTVVYDRDSDGHFHGWDVYAVRGSNKPEAIAADPGKDESFPWVSGDGSKIFWREFHKAGDKVASDFYRFENGKRIPTLVSDNYALLPAMTTHCSELLFTWSVLERDQGGIYGMKNLNQDTLRVIADDEGTMQSSPAISEEGSRAWADMKDIPGSLNIWVTRKGVTAPLTTATNRLLTNPSFSADGKRLVFVDYRQRGDQAVYLVEFLD